MGDWGQLEPTDLNVLQEAFNKALAETTIDRSSEEAREMARYLFKLYVLICTES